MPTRSAIGLEPNCSQDVHSCGLLRCWWRACCLGCWARTLPTALVAAPHGNSPTRPLHGAFRRWTGGRGAFRSPLVVGPPSWSRCSSELPWRCTQLPDRAANCRCTLQCPPRLSSASGSSCNRCSFLLASAGTALRLTSRAEPPSLMVRCCGAMVCRYNA